jgi:hypothetical protein
MTFDIELGRSKVAASHLPFLDNSKYHSTLTAAEGIDVIKTHHMKFLLESD